MKKYKAIILMIICAMAISSCTTFLHKEDISDIKSHEMKEYILTENIGEGSRVLEKGMRVKLHIVTGDDFVKVYAYNTNTSLLKSERALLLYLFDDDFEKSKFNIAIFEEKLFSKIKIAGK